MLGCLLFFSFSFSSFPPLYSSWISLIPLSPSILHGYPIYNSVTINPFYNSAIPTEVRASPPGQIPPVPLLPLAGGCGSRFHQLVSGTTCQSCFICSVVGSFSSGGCCCRPSKHVSGQSGAAAALTAPSFKCTTEEGEWMERCILHVHCSL